MKSLRTLIRVGLISSGLVLWVIPAHAENISGAIATTKIITEDSQLVGNVTCTVVGAACIQFGAPGITLRLNGFTMTGLADPTTGCRGVSTRLENGISTDSQREVTIQGPGLVQRFRANGILVIGGARSRVVSVTASTTCQSGILLSGSPGGSTENHLEGNVLVRNGHAALPCGGICIANGASRNRILRNQTSGNGFIDQPGVSPNNFGIGIVSAGSNDNLIEENSAVGNANGILVVAGTSGNVVRRNIVTGNPPTQVSNSFPDNTGVDIRNMATAGANTFEDNLCVTSTNAPCPNLREIAAFPIATGITFDPARVSVGGSYTATFSGSNLTDKTYFDIRFRPPGSTANEVVWNAQQGTSAQHTIVSSGALGIWTVTGARAHQDINDHSGAFVPVSATISVIFP